MGQQAPATSRNTVPWLCATAVVLALLGLVGWLATSRDTPFKVNAEYEGMSLAFDFSGVDDPAQVLETLLAADVGDDPRAAAKRRYAVELMREHGFVHLGDERLDDVLADLGTEHAAAVQLRGLLYQLKGPFAKEVALAEANATFADAIYTLDRDHALRLRLLNDSLLAHEFFSMPSYSVEVVAAPELSPGSIRVCENSPLRTGEAQVFRLDGDQAFTVVGLVMMDRCKQGDRIGLSPADWSRLVAAEKGTSVRAELRPVRAGTFGLALAYAQ